MESRHTLAKGAVGLAAAVAAAVAGGHMQQAAGLRRAEKLLEEVERLQAGVPARVGEKSRAQLARARDAVAKVAAELGQPGPSVVEAVAEAAAAEEPADATEEPAAAAAAQPLMSREQVLQWLALAFIRPLARMMAKYRQKKKTQFYTPGFIEEITKAIDGALVEDVQKAVDSAEKSTWPMVAHSLALEDAVLLGRIAVIVQKQLREITGDRKATVALADVEPAVEDFEAAHSDTQTGGELSMERVAELEKAAADAAAAATQKGPYQRQLEKEHEQVAQVLAAKGGVGPNEFAGMQPEELLEMSRGVLEEQQGVDAQRAQEDIKKLIELVLPANSTPERAAAALVGALDQGLEAAASVILSQIVARDLFTDEQLDKVLDALDYDPEKRLAAARSRDLYGEMLELTKQIRR